MIYDYCGEDEVLKKEYSSLMRIIEMLDTVVDIWNHPADKRFKRDENEERYEAITSSNHIYIEYLEHVLSFLPLGKKKAKRRKIRIYLFQILCSSHLRGLCMVLRGLHHRFLKVMQ